MQVLCFTWILIVMLSPVLPEDVPSNLQAPKFITQPSASQNIVSEGRIKILQCSALGIPKPEYRWLKDGVYLDESAPQQTFMRIQKAVKSSAGVYQCEASNSVGKILSEAVNLTVAYMHPFADSTESTITVKRGRAAVISLPPIQSNPDPVVTWFSDDRILYGAKYATTPDNRLVILAADPTDQKSYRARATNTQLGQEITGSVRLLVAGEGEIEQDVPEIIIPPEEVETIKGEPSTELVCIANYPDIYDIETTWLKDDIPIEQTGIQYQFSDSYNRTLALIVADQSHSGVYTCRVRRKFIRGVYNSASAHVIVLEKPAIVEKVGSDTLGDFGRPLSLPCQATGTPTPTVTWYRNGVDVKDITGHKYHISDDGSLNVVNVNIEDNGMYQCFARNKAGEATAYTWLKVRTSAPIFEEAPSNGTAMDGKDFTFTCKAGGAPNPNVTWYFGESLVIPSSRLQIADDGGLLITSVRAADQGEYTCVRANEAGIASGKAYLSVLVRTQIVQPPMDTRVIVGHIATLNCKVSSAPSVPYEITWLHENREVDPSRIARIQKHSDGTLEIREARAADAGTYKCVVNSPGGTDYRLAKLEIVELPHPPIGVTAFRLAHTPKTVNVTWIPGFDGNSKVLNWVIQIRVVPISGEIPETLDGWVTETNNITADTRWYLLAHLKAAAAYQIRVSANNSVGEGEPSKPSNRVVLPQESPSGPPLGVVGSARSQSEIMIAWQPPEENLRNGIIMGYVVRYRLQGYSQGPWSDRNVSNEAQRTYLVEDLITWKDYEIQIAAYNAVGLGVFSKGITVKTREGAPEGPPSQIKAKALNSTAVQVWWSPPDPQLINGINQGYKLQAWKGDVGNNSIPDASITVPPSLLDLLAEQTTILNGLEKYTAYNVTVLCFTSPGDGPLSPPVRIRTAEDVPDQVRNLRFEEITDRAVKVIWNAPERENGILLGYTVRWTVRDSPHTLKIRNVTSDVTSVRIAGLQSTTHYTFEVCGWTSVGSGPVSMATIQSGIEPVLPGPPTRLAVSNIEAFSVVLQFTPGFDGNSSITKWSVQARTSRNSTWDTVYEISDPDAIAITVRNLTPFLEYALRIIAHNVVGVSPPSEPSKTFQTLQAAPSHAPYNVTVRAVNSTQLRVRWTPLQQIEWYGVPRGYNITFQPAGADFVRPGWLTVNDHTSNSQVIDNMAEFVQYEIKVQAYNDVGASSFSPPALERTRESVPRSGPVDVSANATSSTTVVVRWGEIPRPQRSGVIEGYKIIYGSSNIPAKSKVVSSNDTFTTTLTELHKFTKYLIQVLAYTRIGDGVLSLPHVSVTTFEDVPGAPSNVTFPDVSFTTARILWDEPMEPNGEILAYKVSYHLDGQRGLNQSKEFPPTERTYRVMNLEPEQFYVFEVTAKTSIGWGEPARVPVYTTNSREAPQPPSRPLVSRSQIQASQVTFSWTPGRDGYAPLRYYTVQYKEGVEGPWKTESNRVDPTVASYTVRNLKPFSEYQFRLQATNDIGPSGWSSESEEVRTLPAAPSVGVASVKVVPITTTSVRVDWTPLEDDSFNGDARTGGYQIQYRPVSDFASLSVMQKEEIRGPKGSQVVLHDLIRDRNYEIIVLPFNGQGSGPPSPPQTVYVGEAVPTGEPRELRAVALSSTEVRINWQPPLASQQNGDLLGYKIFYNPVGLSAEKEEIEVVPASYTGHSLPFMDQYTEYTIEILAFNPAGDGPRSHPVNVRTLQGLPGLPGSLNFTEITMNSLRVSWDTPIKPNGEILGYLVTYETAHQDENFSKQVKQKVNGNTLIVTALEEQVVYHFAVRALSIDYGPPSEGNVTTGPQEGSPGRPKDLLLTRSASSVGLQWENGASGKGPILGYYVEAKKKEEEKWSTVAKTETGPQSDFLVSYQNLLPSTTYLFRVISYNRYGISLPVYSSEEVLTPSKIYLEYGYLQQRPFYHQTWFLVTLAAACVVIVTMLVAILCVKSKSHQYKRKCDEATRTLEESINNEDMGFAIELRQSTRVKTGTIGRRSVAGNTGTLGKPPPRPAPASIAYSDDESAKAYDDNDDGSSVTEKPSLSSSESQSSESEEESVRSDPHSFVNHYANVNDTLRQSWKRQRPVRNYSSYTDSEQEGSAVMSLNGGQIVMNNMARSRAPVSGFSSFV